jgi:hypothetical protein
MNRLRHLIPAFCLLVLDLSATRADDPSDLDDREDERGRVLIQWPSAEFRSLQSAIDAAPDNAVIKIAEGTYEIASPLVVRGKRLLIVGAGSGRKRDERVTRLVGPPPNPVVDERGNLVLRAEAVVGLWNLVAADVQIKHMQLRGFDAGIVSKPDSERSSGPTAVKDVTITDTGRGILSLSSADLTVQHCTIQRTRWNAISFGPKFVDFHFVPNLTTKAVTLIDPQHAGIYFENTFAFIDDANVLGAQAGGIVGLTSASFIQKSNLVGNREGGILLVGGFTEIEDNVVLGTMAGEGGLLGDGISLWASGINQQSLQASLFDNLIQSSERAGISVFGAWVDLADNNIFCASFDVFRVPYGGFIDIVNDLGGNVCGCGTAEICAATGDGPSVPEPVGGLE